LKCTQLDIAQQITCGECVSSTQCFGDAACFVEEDRGYCLPVSQISILCEFPFSEQELKTIESTEVLACGFSNISTGCATYSMLGQPCVGDIGCGGLGCAPPQIVGGDQYCTYECGATNKCPEGMNCVESFCRK